MAAFFVFRASSDTLIKLLVDPAFKVISAIEDPAADLGTVRPRVLMSPPSKRRSREPKLICDLGDSE